MAELYTPDKDGITHINVYSKARTLAGRKLTNYAESPFKHPLFGHFQSMEGFWFWLASGKMYNKLRELSGFKAHQIGIIACNGIDYESVKDERFFEHIIEGTKAKLRQNTDILQLLVETGDLPLVHYYYDYQEINLEKAKVTYLPQHQWQMKVLMDIRKATKEWMKNKGIKSVVGYNFPEPKRNKKG